MYFINPQKRVFKKKPEEKLEISKIIPISNELKDMLNDLVNSSNNSSNNKTSAKTRRICVFSNNIFDFRKKEKDFNREKNLLRN